MRLKESSSLYMIIGIVLCLVAVLIWYVHTAGTSSASRDKVPPAKELSQSPYVFSFDTPGTVEEAGSLQDTENPYWWVNSGGRMIIVRGVGETIQGDLEATSTWRLAYARSNPEDTDDGAHPQNIFRLISRGTWKDFREEAYFRITADNLSKSPNRNESNGLLLFSRYADENNLYYAGVRVDGTAVIKKKKSGAYATLSQIPILTAAKYDHSVHPDLLPKNTWIGLRLETKDVSPDKVSLTLYTDVGKTGVWTQAATAIDDGTSGGAAIEDAAQAGIRTDFMDVQFEGYRVEKI